MQVNDIKSHFVQFARPYNAHHYDLHHIKSDTEHFEFSDSLLADYKYLCSIAQCVEDVARSPNLTQRESIAANELLASALLPVGSNPILNQHLI